jgi:actin-related protein
MIYLITTLIIWFISFYLILFTSFYDFDQGFVENIIKLKEIKFYKKYHYADNTTYSILFLFAPILVFVSILLFIHRLVFEKLT